MTLREQLKSLEADTKNLRSQRQQSDSKLDDISSVHAKELSSRDEKLTDFCKVYNLTKNALAEMYKRRSIS